MTVHRLGRRSAVGGRSDCRLPSAAKPRELPTALFLDWPSLAASPAAAQFNGGATPTLGSPGFSAVTSAGGGGGGGGAYMAAPIMIQAYGGGTISATEYYSLATAGPAASFNNTTEANVKLPVPASGTLTGLVARGNGTAPTGTETWTVTVRDNAAATSLTCTISASSSPANVCQDFSNSVTISKTSPDLIDVQITPANTPTAEQFQFSLLFTATTGQEAPIFASAGSYSTALTATPIYIPIGLADETTPEEKAAVVMPAAGHIDDPYFSLSAAPGASATSQATVFHGSCTSNSATSLVATISGSNTLGTDLAPAHGFDVAAGDCVAFSSRRPPDRRLRPFLTWRYDGRPEPPAPTTPIRNSYGARPSRRRPAPSTAALDFFRQRRGRAHVGLGGLLQRGLGLGREAHGERGFLDHRRDPYNGA